MRKIYSYAFFVLIVYPTETTIAPNASSLPHSIYAGFNYNSKHNDYKANKITIVVDDVAHMSNGLWWIYEVQRK